MSSRFPLKQLLFSLLVFLAAIGAFFSNASAATSKWANPGPYQTLATDDVWTDASRSRQIPVRIYSPVGAKGKRPVIVFSHGLGGSVKAGETWGRQWASWGFISVHIQHHGSDIDAIMNAQGTFEERMKSAITIQQFIERAKDAKFAAAEIARRAARGDKIFGDANPDEIGFSGHSFGAQTTLAVAGESFGGLGAAFADPAYRAFIAFSPSVRDGASLQNEFKSISAPFLSVTGSQDQLAITPAVTPESRTYPYQNMPRGNKCLLWLDTASHMSFAGQKIPRLSDPGIASAIGEGTAPPHQSHIDSVVKAATTAFWLAYLDPDSSAGKEAKAWMKAGGVNAELASGDRWESK